MSLAFNTGATKGTVCPACKSIVTADEIATQTGNNWRRWWQLRPHDAPCGNGCLGDASLTPGVNYSAMHTGKDCPHCREKGLTNG